MNIQQIIIALKKNKKVIENYFFLTAIQMLNSFFYLLIYPYLIRVLGAHNYGQFVFAMSIVTYFIFLVNFGFDLIATKFVAENYSDKFKLENILSIIFTAKNYLFFISVLAFSFIVSTIPTLENNKEIFFICFLSIYSYVLFPQWFFQGLQNMKIITFIQLGVKLLSLPIIFLLVKNKSDLSIYSWIYTGSGLISGLISIYIISFNYNLKIRWVALSKLKIWFVNGLPLFYSSLASIIKENSIPIIIGSFFGMKEVAIYDLANKIISVPRALLSSVNTAIFPKLVAKINYHLIKKIIVVEALISIIVIFFVILFGKFIVEMMGGNEMLQSYYLAIFLSFTILSWLVVGAYLNFVFIPQGKSYLVTYNQLFALVSFFLVCGIGLMVNKNLMIIGAAVACSGLIELIYCHYMTMRLKLFKSN